MSGIAQFNSSASPSPSVLCRFVASRHVRHTLLLLSANLVTGLCGYLLHAILGHLVGPSAYGTFAALVALSSMLLVPTQVIATVVTKHVSRFVSEGDSARVNDLIRRLTALLLPVGIGVAVIYLAVSGFITRFLHLGSHLGVLILGFLFIFSFMAPVNIGAIQGLQRFGWYASLLTFPVFMRLVLASALVLLGFGIQGAVLGIVLSGLVSYAVSFKPIRPILKGPRLPCGSLRPLWTYSLTAAIALISTTILFNLDTLLAKHFLTTQQAGFYAALATTGNIVLVAGSGVMMVMFPKFSALHNSVESHTRSVAQALGSVVILSLIVEVVFCAVPSLMIRVFVGPSFLPIAGQLPWYGLAVMLFTIAQVFIFYFLALGRRLFVMPLLVSCGIQILLFVVRHESVMQLVQAVLATNGILLITLLALYAAGLQRTPLHARRDSELIMASNPAPSSTRP